LFTINDLVKVATPSFASQVSLSTNGLTLGPAGSNVFSLTLENASDAVLQNQSGNNIKFKIRVDATETKTIADVTQTGIMPGLPSAYDLGSDTVRWYRIYANNIAGNLTGNVIGNVTGSLTGNVTGNVAGNLLGNVTGNVNGELFGNASTATSATKLKDAEASTIATASSIVQRDASANITANKFIGIADFADRLKIDNSAIDDVASSYKSAKTTKTANTIAARDSAGNIAANIFNGTATSVQGADLAEKYLADAEYSVGTVVVVGGEKEVTASSWGKRAIGVVSGNPGLMMNQSLDNGTYIALKGRVPVRVIGTVHKGDNLIASNNGCAVAAVYHSSEVFAVALETNVNTEEKIIEAIVL
jgi:regulator of RNase E activity RraA